MERLRHIIVSTLAIWEMLVSEFYQVGFNTDKIQFYQTILGLFCANQLAINCENQQS